tara:strand:- start:804 stop:1790 length:987 start_codon:yes stop_codon:yes gene_type:complete
MNKIPKILICPGDPTGIGYDILLDIIKKKFLAKIIVVTNAKLLQERAILLKKKINIVEIKIDDKKIPNSTPGTLFVHNIRSNKKVKIGQPHIKHAPMILDSLDISIKACLNNNADAIVTGPVQKNILMEYGKKFSGHTEYIARKTGGTPVMMLHSKNLKIALLTTHVSLSKVPKLITKDRLKSYIIIINEELKKNFGIKKPKINVCGLNPHAGEEGYIGKEEKNIIIPAIKEMQRKGYDVNGPFSADTIFNRKDGDIILAMYHDQALPVIKTLEFGNIVNTTLGLPIVRTSVDHGTALDIAGTNKSDSTSLLSAIKTSIDITKVKNGR